LISIYIKFAIELVQMTHFVELIYAYGKESKLILPKLFIMSNL